MAASSQAIESNRKKRIALALLVLGGALLITALIALIILHPWVGVPVTAITIKALASSAGVHAAHTTALLATNKMALFASSTPLPVAHASNTVKDVIIAGFAVLLTAGAGFLSKKLSVEPQKNVLTDFPSTASLIK